MGPIALDKKYSLAIQKHFGFSNYQMLCLSWVIGLLMGFGLALVIHSIF